MLDNAMDVNARWIEGKSRHLDVGILSDGVLAVIGHDGEGLVREQPTLYASAMLLAMRNAPQPAVSVITKSPMSLPKSSRLYEPMI